MTNRHLKLILSTFCKQRHLNDCGLACIRSILQYAGIYRSFPSDISEKMISLFEMQQILAESGLRGRCVRMDPETLRNNPNPCVLHVKTNEFRQHFIVHYYFDSETNLHLIGDPNDKLIYLSTTELNQQWRSKAALYIEHIKPALNWSARMFPWKYLTNFRFIPSALWVSMPLMNVAASLLGLALTVVVEKAIEPQFLSGQTGFLVVIFVLLALLSFSKCFINYLRQIMMIRFGQRIDKWLFFELVKKRFRNSSQPTIPVKYRNVASDVQRIHQSAASLIGGLLSDAAILIVLLLGLSFYAPVLVLVELIAVLLMFWTVDHNLPYMMISQQQPLTVPDLFFFEKREPELVQKLMFEKTRDQNQTLSLKTSKISRYINRMNLQFELISAVNIIVILIYGIVRLKNLSFSYEHFLFSAIACYAIATLGSKMSNQLLPIAQGAAVIGEH